MSDHGSGHVVDVADLSGRWQCACGKILASGFGWKEHSDSFMPAPQNWIELAVPLTGVTLENLSNFLKATQRMDLHPEMPVTVTIRQGVGNDRWQTYVVLRADRDTSMPGWLREMEAKE